jgi:Uma2 family endonuclease
MVTSTQPTTTRVEIIWAGTLFDEWPLLAPVDARHDALLRYLSTLFETYLRLRPVGELRTGGCMMGLGWSPYEPDIQIILHNNPNRITPNFTDGPADIVIEIVSPATFVRDSGAEFEEFEQGKVPEYWVIDPIHKDARFYRLDEDGTYIAQPPDAQGDYSTPALPDLTIQVPELWQDELPGPIEITRRVEDMLKE